jgi:hypothetical protein
VIVEVLLAAEATGFAADGVIVLDSDREWLITVALGVTAAADIADPSTGSADGVSDPSAVVAGGVDAVLVLDGFGVEAAGAVIISGEGLICVSSAKTDEN